MANSPARSAIDVGSVIADTYTIEALIGRGGMGAVFLASHRRLPGKKVAIKVLHTDAEDAEVLVRFRREAEIASRLGHPNIVGVSDFNITADGTPYLVLDYLQGETLAHKLRNGPIAIEQLVSIIRQIGSALAAAHRAGIVHRDLKPQNIFLCPTEVDGRLIEIAKVLDFGISKIRGSQTVQTQDNSLLGTPQYMAPEQATGQHAQVDERTDVFALGAIVYEMLTGHPAFQGASIPEVVFKVVYEQPKPLIEEAPATPQAIVDAVAMAMQKRSDDRYPTVSAFVEALTGRALASFKLPTTPPPDIGFAAGSKISNFGPSTAPMTAEEAIANTVGSDTPPRSSLAVAATVDSQRRGLGVDATMASNTARPAPAPVAVVVAPGATTLDSLGPATPTVREPARTLPVAIIVGAVVLVGAAIVAAIVLTRGGGDSKVGGTGSGSSGSAIALVAPSDAAVVVPVAIDAATPVPAALDARVEPALDAAVVKAKPDGGDKPIATPKTPEDPEAAATLAKAQAALANGQYELADQLGNQVVMSELRSPDQAAHAQALRAMAFCNQSNEEQARNTLRSSSRWRAMALRVCHDKGQLLTDQ